MKREIITIAGSLGSGKSSTAKGVAAALGYAHFSSGDLFRKIAKDRGVSVEAINLTAEEQQDIDYEVDNLLQKMYQTEERLVIDSRMAWHWMPDSFKVFLQLDPETAAERIFAHMQREGRESESAASVEEVRKSIDRRFASEQKRYFTLYQVDATRPENYNTVVDTKQNDLSSVISIVLSAYNEWRAI